MAESKANYIEVKEAGEDAPRARSRAIKVGAALLVGGSCVALVGIIAMYTLPLPTSSEDSTSLIAMPGASLRSAAMKPLPKLAPKMPAGVPALASLPGGAWKDLALAGVEASNKCGRDVTANAKLRAAWDRMPKEAKVWAEGAIAKEMAEVTAGKTAPMGYWDPLQLSANAGPGKLMYLREAEVKHGRVCMLASVGYIFGELWHPFFGGNLDMESYKVALPQYYASTGMGTFWAALAFACAIPELLYSVPTLKGFGEMKEDLGDRVPGDFGYDPWQFKDWGFAGTNMLDMQNKELNNGRLAMLGMAGMVAQELAQGTTLLPGIAGDSDLSAVR